MSFTEKFFADKISFKVTQSLVESCMTVIYLPNKELRRKVAHANKFRTATPETPHLIYTYHPKLGFATRDLAAILGITTIQFRPLYSEIAAVDIFGYRYTQRRIVCIGLATTESLNQ